MPTSSIESLFSKFSAEDVAKLKAEFDVPRAKLAQFVLHTQGYVHVFSRLNVKYKKKEKTDVKRQLAGLQKACESLICICESLLWPAVLTVYDPYDLRLRASQRLFQACSYQIVLANGGPKAQALSRQFLNGISTSSYERTHRVSDKELQEARHLICRTNIPKDVSGMQAKILLISMLAALDDAARLALNMETEHQGRPSGGNIAWLVRELKKTYEEYTGRKATKGRGGMFSKYLTICLKAAGASHKDLMPLLSIAIGKKKTLKENRVERELDTSKQNPLDRVWYSGNRGEKKKRN
jgi:hypothetical protein